MDRVATVGANGKRENAENAGQATNYDTPGPLVLRIPTHRIATVAADDKRREELETG